MEKQSSSIWKHLLMVIIICMPAVYAGSQWNAIPEIIPTHFNASMKPDSYGNKSFIWSLIALMSGVSLLVYLLMINIHKIDPKRINRKQSSVFNKIGIGTVLFIVALETKILIKMIHPEINAFDSIELPIIGLLFVFLGNYMNNLKPNYFAGFKLAWTLASDYNWRKTHRLAGKLWFAGGLLITIITLFTPPATGIAVLLTSVAVMVIIPTVFSYNLFRKEHKNPGYYDKETEEQDATI